MEVIIVVAIIAILASAVLIALNPAKNLRDARNATRWSQMNSITNGIYSYYILIVFPLLPAESFTTKMHLLLRGI